MQPPGIPRPRGPPPALHAVQGWGARAAGAPRGPSNRSHHNDTAHLPVWGEPLVDQETLPEAMLPTRPKSEVNSGGDFTLQFGGGGGRGCWC